MLSTSQTAGFAFEMFTILPEAHSPVVNVASRLRARAVCVYICTAGMLHE